MTTNRQITKAIKDATGIKGVSISARGGVCRFVCDENEEMSFALINLDSVYIMHMNQQSASEWVKDFVFMAKEEGIL